MSDPIIPERIYNYYPNVKLIFVLCEPLHRTLSHYLHAVFLSQIRQNKDLAEENQITLSEDAPQRAFFAKMGAYNDVIQDGLDVIFENEPKLYDKLNDLQNEFQDYKELREAIYRCVYDFRNRIKSNRNRINYELFEFRA